MYRVTGTGARGGAAGDLGGGVQVIMSHQDGSIDVLYLHQGAERDHLAGLIASFEIFDIFRLSADRGVRLGSNVVRAAVEGEVVDIKRPKVHREGIPDFIERDLHRLGFGAVDIEVDLRNTGAEGREGSLDASILIGSGGKLIGRGLQCSIP